MAETNLDGHSAESGFRAEKMKVAIKIGGRSQMGFTLVELVIVGALIALLAVIAIPNFLQSRSAAQKSTCINNLRQIDAAIQQWAIEQRMPSDATVDSTDIAPYLRRLVICPAGGTTFADSYSISTVSAAPACQRLPLTHVLPASIVDASRSQAQAAAPLAGTDSPVVNQETTLGAVTPIQKDKLAAGLLAPARAARRAVRVAPESGSPSSS